MDAFTSHPGTALCVIAAVASAFAWVLPFLRPPDTYPKWARRAFALFSVTMLLWGMLQYVTVFERAALSKDSYLRLYHLNPFVGGVAVGVFAVLLVGGAFTRLLNRPPTTSTPELKGLRN